MGCIFLAYDLFTKRKLKTSHKKTNPSLFAGKIGRVENSTFHVFLVSRCIIGNRDHHPSKEVVICTWGSGFCNFYIRNGSFWLKSVVPKTSKNAKLGPYSYSVIGIFILGASTFFLGETWPNNHPTETRQKGPPSKYQKLLVGGWTNPLMKHMLGKFGSFPPKSGWN